MATASSSVTTVTTASPHPNTPQIAQLTTQVNELGAKYQTLEHRLIGMDGAISSLATKTDAYFELLVRHLGIPLNPPGDAVMADVSEAQKRKHADLVGMAPNQYEE